MMSVLAAVVFSLGLFLVGLVVWQSLPALPRIARLVLNGEARALPNRGAHQMSRQPGGSLVSPSVLLSQRPVHRAGRRAIA